MKNNCWPFTLFNSTYICNLPIFLLTIVFLKRISLTFIINMPTIFTWTHIFFADAIVIPLGLNISHFWKQHPFSNLISAKKLSWQSLHCISIGFFTCLSPMYWQNNTLFWTTYINYCIGLKQGLSPKTCSLFLKDDTHVSCMCV